MKRLFLLVVIMLTVSLACGSSSSVVTNLQATDVQSTVEVVVSSATSVAVNTATTGPTKTSKSTNTPKPTNTPEPTATPEPTQESEMLSGTGSDVVNNPWLGPGLLHITYTGGSNFAIINYDENNEYMDLLVNTIGHYEGTVPLDFEDGTQTYRFEVTASGPWTIEIEPLNMMRYESIPGNFTGNGDDVVLIKGGTPDLLKVQATGSSNFAIWSYGDDGRDLLVNEIAPYSGTVMIPKGTLVLVITAEGPWSIEVTTR